MAHDRASWPPLRVRGLHSCSAGRDGQIKRRLRQMAIKLTGPQTIVLRDMKPDGYVYRGKRNETCIELRRLGLLKYDPQPSPYGFDYPRQPAWLVTPEGLIMHGNLQMNEGQSRLACGCVLGYERCFDCRPGLHLDQEMALSVSLNPEGYYGCKMPPGFCGCPQDTRHRCQHSHWVVLHSHAS